jgi:hypothetical protein
MLDVLATKSIENSALKGMAVFFVNLLQQGLVMLTFCVEQPWVPSRPCVVLTFFYSGIEIPAAVEKIGSPLSQAHPGKTRSRCESMST